MKRIAFVIIILLAIPLIGEWRWVKKHVGWPEFPDDNYYFELFDYPTCMVYDKSIHKSVLVNGALGAWTYDGEKWEHVCDQMPDPISKRFFNLYYDENIGSLVGLFMRDCAWNYCRIEGMRFDPSLDECWESLFTSTYGYHRPGSEDTSTCFSVFDTRRKIAVIGPLSHHYMLEYDGVNVVRKEIPFEFQELVLVGYDESSGNTIYIGYNTDYEPSYYLYDGTNWTQVQIPLEPPWFLGNSPLPYMPEFGGIVYYADFYYSGNLEELYASGFLNTWLLKNANWAIIDEIKTNASSYPNGFYDSNWLFLVYDSDRNVLVYYSIGRHYSDRGNGIFNDFVYELMDLKHGRPFNRPE